MTKLSAIHSRRQLASVLQVKYSSICYHAYRVSDSKKYRRFAITKRRGGERLIEEPIGGLKAIQRKLASLLLEVYSPKPCVHGFVAGRSIISNARVHCRKRHILNVDLRDFFGCINFGRVRGMLLGWPHHCNEEVATLIAQLCCHENRLPQGAPTSPILSNMVAARMDSDLAKLAAAARCSYTRYADDMTFSTNLRSFPNQLARWVRLDEREEVALGAPLVKKIESNGFSINWEKVRLMHRSRRQVVTGIKTNAAPNVSDKYLNQLRAMLYAWRKWGLDAAEEEYRSKFDNKHRNPNCEPINFARVVLGKLSFLRQVRGDDDHKYRKYAKEYFELTNTPVPWESLSLFYCYSHDDETLLTELTKHLSALKREGVLSEWHDRKLIPGDVWEDKIGEELSRANVVLLLVSASFLASDYCWHVEMKKALERHRNGHARVIPVILRECDWKQTDLGKLQALPKDGRAVTSWTNRDEAFTDVAKGIRNVAAELLPRSE